MDYVDGKDAESSRQASVSRLTVLATAVAVGLAGCGASDNGAQIQDLEERVTKLESDLLSARSDIDLLDSELGPLRLEVRDSYAELFDFDHVVLEEIESGVNELRDRIECLSSNWGNMYVGSDAVDWVNDADPFC